MALKTKMATPILICSSRATIPSRASKLQKLHLFKCYDYVIYKIIIKLE